MSWKRCRPELSIRWRRLSNRCSLLADRLILLPRGARGSRRKAGAQNRQSLLASRLALLPRGARGSRRKGGGPKSLVASAR
jgi:hypothetical protein